MLSKPCMPCASLGWSAISYNMQGWGPKFDFIAQIFGRQILWHQFIEIKYLQFYDLISNRKCCAQHSFTLLYLQKRTIVIVLPAKTTESVAIFQIPTDVLAFQHSLGKTVKVAYSEYSYDVSTLLPTFSMFFFMLGSYCSS